MAGRPTSTPCAPDLLLIVGMAAIVYGVRMVAAGVLSPDGQVTTIDHGTLSVLTARCAGDRPISPTEADAAAIAPQLVVHAPAVTPAPRRPRERFAGDGLQQTNVQESDARNFLMRTAMARWSSASKSWDQSRGYGEAKANRAASTRPGWVWAPIG